MAGGAGERFWPLSRKTRPKQLLRLVRDDKTLLEEAIETVFPLTAPEQCHIITNTSLQDPIRQALPTLPHHNIIAEPLRRSTTGCLLYAAAWISARYSPEALLAIITADHRVEDAEMFRQTIRAALHKADTEDALVGIGVKPTRPETGFGYVEVNEDPQYLRHFEGIPIYPVAFFREKPHQELAEEYIRNPRFYWNTGMYFWKIQTFRESLQRYRPELAETLDQLTSLLQAYPNNPTKPEIAEVFSTIPNLSIDYVLMEKAENVFMVPGFFGWDDIGAWDCLDRLRPPDENGNLCIGDPILIDCHNATVVNESGPEQMAVGVVGYDNIVVVTTRDGVLVCPKERAQEVRKIVQELINNQARQV
jgi:mannose-1-phosphate guanylyltransferase